MLWWPSAGWLGLGKTPREGNPQPPLTLALGRGRALLQGAGARSLGPLPKHLSTRDPLKRTQGGALVPGSPPQAGWNSGWASFSARLRPAGSPGSHVTASQGMGQRGIHIPKHPQDPPPGHCRARPARRPARSKQRCWAGLFGCSQATRAGGLLAIT